MTTSTALRVQVNEAALLTGRTWPGAVEGIDLSARRALAADVLGLRAALLEEGVSRVVLVGTGLAPRVARAICRDAGTDLVVLDSLDPTPVVDALAGDLSRTVLVVLQDGPVAEVLAAGLAAGGIDPLTRTVRVGPGSHAGVRAHVPDRAEGVLGAGVIVAAGLAGAELEELLDDAEDASHELDTGRAEAALPRLAAGLAASGERAAVRIGAAEALAEVVEQLVSGAGLVAAVVGDDDSSDLRLQGPLAAQLLLVSAAAELLGSPPSGRAGAPHDRGPSDLTPAVTDDAGWLRSAGLGAPTTLTEALTRLVDSPPEAGHLAVRAHLDRTEDASARLVRDELARRCRAPVTFAFGSPVAAAIPSRGVHLVLTGTPEQDLGAPGGAESLGELHRQQALAESRALARSGVGVLWVHLADRLVGLARLLGAIQELERR